jgi:hypothetical protein
MTDAPDNALILSILREIRAEQREQRSLLLTLTDYTRRLDRRIGNVERRFDELKDDLKLMVKSELMGRLAHFETTIEQRLDALEEKARS